MVWGGPAPGHPRRALLHAASRHAPGISPGVPVAGRLRGSVDRSGDGRFPTSTHGDVCPPTADALPAPGLHRFLPVPGGLDWRVSLRAESLAPGRVALCPAGCRNVAGRQGHVPSQSAYRVARTALAEPLYFRLFLDTRQHPKRCGFRAGPQVHGVSRRRRTRISRHRRPQRPRGLLQGQWGGVAFSPARRRMEPRSYRAGRVAALWSRRLREACPRVSGELDPGEWLWARRLRLPVPRSGRGRLPGADLAFEFTFSPYFLRRTALLSSSARIVPSSRRNSPYRRASTCSTLITYSRV